ncbi:uncharacterized protein TCAP_07301 [Tolypocladium capitatum]|uniref:Uncharacterized protein n=1 Tax=Tolypocladium capitatum TaxID=45235 RepID=A0A2K3Q039_9HYPO|nr:uncharacterized protein TCAP_07301 [Tolypocladium capitatum]
MRFSALVAAAISTTAASASPIEKRELGGVLLCTGPNATGKCQHNVYQLDKCHQLRAPFYRSINTFAPDGEAFVCYPRVVDCGGICTSPTGCTFGAVGFAYAHKYNLSAIGWDVLFSSFDCSNRTHSARPDGLADQRRAFPGETGA